MKKVVASLIPIFVVMVMVCGTASADLIKQFTQTNTQGIPCSAGTPCGTVTVTVGTGAFANDLVVTVQLSGPAAHFQLDRFGFNSDVANDLVLECFAFSSSCSSGTGSAQLTGNKQFDGFGTFENLDTGLNGGSGCAPNGAGCKNLLTFVIGDASKSLTLSDIDDVFAGHAAQGEGNTGYIATGPGGAVPEPSSFLLLGSGVLGLGAYSRNRLVLRRRR